MTTGLWVRALLPVGDLPLIPTAPVAPAAAAT